MQDSTNKMNFLKKVLISIKDFDKYELFIKENIGQTIKYLLKLVAIFVVLLTAIGIFTLSDTTKRIFDVLNKEVSELHYEDGTMIINNNEEKIVTDFQENIGDIIINTSEFSEDQMQKYRTEISNKTSGLYIFRDRIIIKNSNLSTITEAKYQDIIKSNEFREFNKDTLLDYYNKSHISIYIIFAVVIYFYLLFIYSFNILVDCLAFTLLAFITARIVKINLKWVASFNLAVHASTLPIILNMLYVIINAVTGFTMKYFPIMYTAVTYIYILTIILMIKSDYIKIISEVQKIEEEQKRIREKLEEAKEEEKRKKEEEEVKKKDREKEKENKSKEPRIGNRPEGDNA